MTCRRYPTTSWTVPGRCSRTSPDRRSSVATNTLVNGRSCSSSTSSALPVGGTVPLGHAREARAIAEQTQEAQVPRDGRDCRVLRGGRPWAIRPGPALSRNDEGLRHAASVSDEGIPIGCRAALGHLELVRGDVAAAAEWLRDVPERMSRMGWFNGNSNHSADAIEALVGVGELNSARAYLEEFLEIARARTGGRASALRGRRVWWPAAEGDRTRAIDAFERAVAADDDPPTYPFERARTLLAMGAVQRQALQRRSARETLEQALAISRSWARAPGRRRPTRDWRGSAGVGRRRRS